MSHFRTFALAAATALVVATGALADQLFVPGISAGRQVTFTDFRDGKLIYQNRGGDQNDAVLDEKLYIAVDGEAPFNEADAAFAKGDKAKSVDGYVKTLRSTSKPWLKTYASQRLLSALQGSDRFDAKLVAYLSLLTTSPDTAANFKPALPAKGNKQLDTAVTDIETALKQPNLPGPQQLALYNFLIEIQRQRGDEAAIASTLERIDKLSSVLGDQPEVKAQLAGLRVNQARVAMEAKKYSEAVKLINDNRTSISDPRTQADALYILAQSKLATANKNDKDAMKDAAIDFMRVVAHFNDFEGKPNVLPSLQATATILEQIGETDAAAAVLQQIAADFASDPAAGKAKADLARIKPAS